MGGWGIRENADCCFRNFENGESLCFYAEIELNFLFKKSRIYKTLF